MGAETVRTVVVDRGASDCEDAGARACPSGTASLAHHRERDDTRDEDRYLDSLAADEPLSEDAEIAAREPRPPEEGEPGEPADR